MIRNPTDEQRQIALQRDDPRFACTVTNQSYARLSSRETWPDDVGIYPRVLTNRSARIAAPAATSRRHASSL